MAPMMPKWYKLREGGQPWKTVGSMQGTTTAWPPIRLVSDKPNNYFYPTHLPAGYGHYWCVFACRWGSLVLQSKAITSLLGKVICGTMKGSNQIEIIFLFLLLFQDAIFDCHRFVLNYAAVMVTMYIWGIRWPQYMCVAPLLSLTTPPKRERKAKRSKKCILFWTGFSSRPISYMGLAAECVLVYSG